MSIGSAILLSIMILLFRKAGIIGVPPLAIMTITLGTATSMFCVQSYASGKSLNIGAKALGYLILAVVASYFANLLSVFAIADSPNPGFVIAISSFSAIFISFFSYYFFNDALTLKQLIGIIIMIIGVSLIVV